MASRKRAALAGDRCAERLPVDAETRMRPNSWSNLQIGMLDLSTAGFRARCEARLLPGSSVSLDVPGIGTVEAQVEWQRGGEFGARFFSEIDLGRCDWTVGDSHHPLARLLVDRASAMKAGRAGADDQLRRQILAALPMRKVGAIG